jgi:hypothetical protein
LLVVTHVDADHIAGVLRLLETPNVQVTFSDIWFNGYVHLKPETMDAFGGVQGERLTTILRDPERRLPWNRLLERKAVRLNVDGTPKEAPLPDGAIMRVIAADEAQLVRLEPQWRKVCLEAGLVPSVASPPQLPVGFEAFGPIDVPELAESKFREDDALANGSSIGLVFEFAGKRIALLGDAFPSVLMKGVDHLSPGARFRADVVKVAHHGSRNNTSAELVQRFDAEHWVFSTSGAIFKHPNREAVARTVYFSKGAHLWFNYRSDQTAEWDDDRLKKKHQYSTSYGDGERPLTVPLL